MNMRIGGGRCNVHFSSVSLISWLIWTSSLKCLAISFSWKLQCPKVHVQTRSRSGLLSHGLFYSIYDDSSHVMGNVLAAS